MGLLSSRRALLAGGGIPSWVLPGANFDIDFVHNRAWIAGCGVTTPAAILTCTRASPGEASDTAGNWYSYNNGILRQTNQGALIEEARTNVITYSNSAYSTQWVLTNVTATDNNAVAPDGSSNASTLSDGVAVAVSHEAAGPNFNFVSGITYTQSVFFKNGTRQYVQLTFPSSDFSGLGYANFDLVNGVVSGTGGTLVSSSITVYANGWTRCQITATATGSGASASAVVFTQNIGTATRGAGYTGTNATLLAWIAQTEANPGSVGYASSPIPTAGSAVTRAGDVATMPFAGGSAYSLYMSGVPLTNDYGLSQVALMAWVTNIGTSAGIARQSGGNDFFYSNNNANFSVTSTALAINALAKMAVGVGPGAQNAAVNGGSPQASTFTASSGLTTVSIGSAANSTQFWNGYIERVAGNTQQALPASTIVSWTTGVGP